MTSYRPEFSASEQSQIDAEFSRLASKWRTMVKYPAQTDNEPNYPSIEQATRVFTWIMRAPLSMPRAR